MRSSFLGIWSIVSGVVDAALMALLFGLCSAFFFDVKMLCGEGDLRCQYGVGFGVLAVITFMAVVISSRLSFFLCSLIAKKNSSLRMYSRQLAGFSYSEVCTTRGLPGREAAIKRGKRNASSSLKREQIEFSKIATKVRSIVGFWGFIFALMIVAVFYNLLKMAGGI